jgi:hypothetical protein
VRIGMAAAHVRRKSQVDLLSATGFQLVRKRRSSHFPRRVFRGFRVNSLMQINGFSLVAVEPAAPLASEPYEVKRQPLCTGNQYSPIDEIDRAIRLAYERCAFLQHARAMNEPATNRASDFAALP